MQALKRRSQALAGAQKALAGAHTALAGAQQALKRRSQTHPTAPEKRKPKQTRLVVIEPKKAIPSGCDKHQMVVIRTK